MQVHLIDPAYTASARARANFRLAAQLAFAFVALLWLVHLSNWALDLDPGWLGVRPREWAGLAGVLFAPVLHGNFDHLVANSLPVFVLGTAMLYLYPGAALTVLPAVYVGPGLFVWLFAESGVHVGASGLVYGLVSYIFIAGLIRRDRRAIAASMLVAFLYGTLVWGVLPIRTGVSWETHLAAAIIGAVLAAALRHRDVPPRRHYDWEGEVDEPEREAPEAGAPVEASAQNDEERETKPTLH
jgi:membrane associated rhomboid family serine protease